MTTSAEVACEIGVLTGIVAAIDVLLSQSPQGQASQGQESAPVQRHAAAHDSEECLRTECAKCSCWNSVQRVLVLEEEKEESRKSGFEGETLRLGSRRTREKALSEGILDPKAPLCGNSSHVDSIVRPA